MLWRRRRHQRPEPAPLLAEGARPGAHGSLVAGAGTGVRSGYRRHGGRGPPSPRPPPFSSLYFPTDAELDRFRATVTETACDSLLATAPAPSFEEALAEDEAECEAERETKAALPQDTKAQSSFH